MVGKLAFLFPGQGSQAIGMGKSAAAISPRAAERLKEADQILGFGLSQIMFEGPEEKLKETHVTQPALFAASAAALELLLERGLAPTWAAGHSLGEYSALYAAGVLAFEDALRLVQERGKAMNEAAKAQAGTMAAIIGLDAAKVSSLCQEASSGGVCTPANFNSDSQIVISGSVPAVTKAMELATQAGAAKVVQLNVAGAFHSPLMAPAAERMKTVLSSITFRDAQIPVVTNVDAQPTTSGAQFKDKLIRQIDGAVRWHETALWLAGAGAESFVEVGSGRVLGSMMKRIDRKKPVYFTDEFDAIEKALAAGSIH